MTFAQDAASSGNTNEHALEIDNSVLDNIFGSTWICQDRLVHTSDGYWNSTFPFNLTIHTDKTYRMLDDKRSYTGTWELVNDQSIKFNVNPEKAPELEGMLNGVYNITKSSYNKTMLSKATTDQEPTKCIFKFYSEDFAL